jgi:hypothetical protein
MSKPREIIKELRFEQEMAAIEPDVQRADEFLEGAETLLSRVPEIGHRLGSSHVYFIPGWTIDLNIYYTFNDDYVFLLSISRMAPPEP